MQPTDVIYVMGTLVGGGVGGAVAVTGLSRWLGDVWLGRILEKEKAKYGRELEQLRAGFAEKLEWYKDALDRSKNLLQARIENSVFVTRAHFETEFGAFKKVFEDLAEVRLIMPGMRPAMTLSPPGETPEARLKTLKEDLLRLQRAHNKTMTTVENLSPFYPEEIFVKLNECLRVVRGEILDIQTGGDSTFTLEWYKEGRKRLEDFVSAYDAASKAIRHRISTLAVLPSE